MPYQCPLHNWFSWDFPCPSCVTTTTSVDTENVIIAASQNFDHVEIKPYIYEKSKVNGFDFYKYLYIKGGSGNWKGKSEDYLNGGEYDFCLFYAMPEEMEGINCCERIWCIYNKIPFGTGKTIEEAYKNYQSKLTEPNK